MKVSWRIAKRWVAGKKLEDAIKVTKELGGHKLKVLINFLGENITDRRDAEKIFAEYSRILNEIRSHRLNADITIKPTQFCLHPHSHYCSATLAKLLAKAKKKRVLVWIDMENSLHTENTIALYLSLLKTYPNIGIAIQAYLKRSYRDTKKIISHGGIIRLVKGAYPEGADVAYTKKSSINKNFLRLLKVLFAQSRQFALGTHDEKLIEAALRLNKKYKREVEFQMLNGVKEELARRLASKNKVAVYLPYGIAWQAFILRRLREKAR